MLRSLFAAAVAALVLSRVAAGQKPVAAAAGDRYVGTFVGEALAIQLQRSGRYYVGTARSSGGQYPVQAQIVGGVLVGIYNNNGVQSTFQAQVRGDVMQLVAGGTSYVMQRRRGGGGVGRTGRAGSGGGGGGGAVATSPQDRQIAQLLVSSRWCYFSYSQTSGATHTERVQFFQNGTAVRSTGAESYSSGANGTVAGQSSGGDRGLWRVQNGMLVLSEDGATWTPQRLQITRNSSGYPIVNTGGKEYSQCN